MPDRYRLKSPICGRFCCKVTILSAGMGGVARSEPVAAVAEAGGYGILGMMREDFRLIAQKIDAVSARTNRPFAVNLIPAATAADLLDTELNICFERGAPAMCFFWNVVPDAVARAKPAGCLVLHQVVSLAAPRDAETAGADILIVQGVEAREHVHGTVWSLVLVEEVARAVSLPVIASGRFTTGSNLVVALALGAQGIHCGTAFLATNESFAHDDHKARVLAAPAEDIVYTDAFALNWPPNSPLQVIRNSVTDGHGHRLMGHHPDHLPCEIVGEDSGRSLMKYSTGSPLRPSGDLEAMAAFAEQSVALLENLPTAAERIGAIMSEAQTVLAHLNRLTTRI